MAAVSTLDDRVMTAATLASVTLALLVLFTTWRVQKFSRDDTAGIDRLSLKTLWYLLPDLILAAATFGAVAAMSRLFRDTFSVSHWTNSAHAVESLFSLAYLGFAALLIVQLTLAWLRFWRSVRQPRQSRAST